MNRLGTSKNGCHVCPVTTTTTTAPKASGVLKRVIVLSLVSILFYGLGIGTGLLISEGQFKQRIGYSPEQLNDAKEKVKELLQKAKNNGL